MLKYSKLAGILAAALFVLAGVAPAQAQAVRTWVASTGDDVNPCSRTLPCHTFAGAIPKTAPGGEIDCVDPGNFNPVTITKSITLDCGGGIGGQVGSIGVSASAMPGITVSGTAIVVKIRNLTLNGTANLGTQCIKFITGATLFVEHVTMFDFGGGSAPCVDFEPTVAGAKLFMRDVEIQNNFSTGVLIKPVGAVAASGTLNNVDILGNGGPGLMVNDGAAVTFLNSNTSGNTKGVFVQSAGTPAFGNLYNSVVANNTVAGIQTSGSQATVTLYGSGIYNNNGTGISAATGTVTSFANNALGMGAGNAGTGNTVAPTPY
ncbi:MAG TPA: right-handed parallel beta-helix repeat-containing protein [Rhizomicrobium sp.]|nr:right-handed parallel beta-helix repeat-containing protein [Rhizomicrobium sp.]